MADKTFYINFDRGERVNSDGSTDSSQARLYYQEVPSWKIRFINEAGTAVDVSSVTTWASAVDDDFDSASDPWCRILNADIDSTDAATGIIIVPVDSNTTEFQTGIGTSEYKTAYFELRGLNASNELVAYVRFTILAKNTLDPGGGSPGAVPGNYYTKSESDNRYIRQALSTAYSAKTVLVGTELIPIRDASTTKYVAVSNLTGTSSEQDCADDTATNITLFDKTVYSSCRVVFTIDDAGTNLIKYVYEVGYDGTNADDDGGKALVYKGAEISGVAITFDVSGDNVRMIVTLTSVGNAVNCVYTVNDLLIQST